MDDLDYVLATIDPWLDKYLNHGPIALAEIELIAVGVWMLEAEVNNGGFDQYYFNSAGDMAVATVESLKAIGAPNTASLLAAANSEFPESTPPANRSLRQGALDRIRGKARFSALESEFYKDSEKLITRLAQFLRNNLSPHLKR